MKGELRWRGLNSISVSGHHNIKEGAVYCRYMKSQVEGVRGGLDNLLMSMYVQYIYYSQSSFTAYLTSQGNSTHAITGRLNFYVNCVRFTVHHFESE
jgi:hypothetical protein